MDSLDLWSQLAALGQVIAIDLVLAGDNAIVVGMAAAAVPLAQRRKVIFSGIGAAILLRIFFALITRQLLAIIGLLLSVVLMGAAANMIAHLLHKHRWIGWVGLVIITYVAFDMIWRGSQEVLQHTAWIL